jgi:hypothetical protein
MPSSEDLEHRIRSSTLCGRLGRRPRCGTVAESADGTHATEDHTEVTVIEIEIDAVIARQSPAGPDAVVRASAVAANFQMMNRLVDATGVPVGASLSAIAPDLGLDG